MAILGSKSHSLAFLRILDRTVNRTVMHRHGGSQIPKWQSDTVIYGVHRQTVFGRTVPSHRHCTALTLKDQVTLKHKKCTLKFWFDHLHKFKVHLTTQEVQHVQPHPFTRLRIYCSMSWRKQSRHTHLITTTDARADVQTHTDIYKHTQKAQNTHRLLRAARTSRAVKLVEMSRTMTRMVGVVCIQHMYLCSITLQSTCGVWA